jgi:pimeloyl-ACP methyl ester carboxylesterase
MTFTDAQGISLYYETYGDPGRPCVLLPSGLAGVGAGWSSQIGRFAGRYHGIVLDQRGTGRTSRTDVRHSTKQLAAEMFSLVEHLGVGPAHLVGASTGGAIAQHMARDHRHAVATLTLVASFARFDAYLRREFAAWRRMAEWDREALLSALVFLFAPAFARDNPEKVSAWIERAAAVPRRRSKPGRLRQRAQVCVRVDVGQRPRIHHHHTLGVRSVDQGAHPAGTAGHQGVGPVSQVGPVHGREVVVLAVPRQHHLGVGLGGAAHEIVDEFDGQQGHVDGAHEGQPGARIRRRTQSAGGRRQGSKAPEFIAHDASLQRGQRLSLRSHDENRLAALPDDTDHLLDHGGRAGSPRGPRNGQIGLVAAHALRRPAGKYHPGKRHCVRHLLCHL